MQARKMIIGIAVVLVAAACFAEAKVRDVKAIGEEALRKGVISAPSAGRDFTKIPKGASYKEGRLLVRFEPRKTKGKLSAMSSREKKRILNSLGGAKEKRGFDIVPGLSVVELPAGMAVEEALKKFNKKSGIMYAEPDYKYTASRIPNDTRFDELWGMIQIEAPEAWDISTDSNITVALTDSGVSYAHPDLASNIWINPGEDFPPLGVAGPEDFNGVDDDDNGYTDDIYGWDFGVDDDDPYDYFGHGTHCAGTIGAVGNNAKGVVGVCWDVNIMVIKVDDDTGWFMLSAAVEGIEYAVDEGAKVMSASWGGYEYSQALYDVIKVADDANVLFVAAAHNYGKNNDVYPMYPASFDCNNIISVMATDQNDARSVWPSGASSNYGATSVDLGAPGSDILSCNPLGQYVYMNGTSMATPHVTGACALLWALHPELSYLEVKDILLATVDETDPPLVCVSGGRLNLYKALTYAVAKGIIRLDRDYYSCDDEVKITLVDSGLTGASQNVLIETTGGDWEDVNLIEVDPNVYQGTISTDGNAVDSNDGVLQLSTGDIITVTYYDANDGTSNDANVTDTAEADCNYPVISDVGYEEIVLLPGSQSITFETDELTFAKVYCGQDCNDPCDIEKSDESFSTEHTITLSGLSPKTQYYFVIEVTDKAENITIDDNGGNCYSFYTYPRDIDVPGDFNTIQEAIDDSYDGCIVWVATGTYTGTGNSNIDFDGKAITVRGTDPNDWDVVAATIIDCNGSSGSPRHGFIFSSGEDADSVLEGFTIINGYGYSYYGPSAGGAIYCEASDPTIRRCVLRNNTNDKVNNTDGGAIACYWSQPVIEECKIYDNEAKNGGGIRIFGNPSPTIRNCMIWGNSAVTGGGIDNYYGSNIDVDNCTIADNSADTGGGVYSNSYSATNKIASCILWGNGDDLYNWSATYSCIEDNDSGEGNIHDDPCFIDDVNDDYHLKLYSPCIDAGDPNGNYDGQLDIDNEIRVMGLRVDIGADEKAGRVCNVTQEEWYEHIQDAIDEAVTGDDIVVYPGTYNESVNFEGKAITVRSTDPNDPNVVAATIIDAGGNDSAVEFFNSEDANSVLNGFTLNGFKGIECVCSSPTISNCVIEDCDLGMFLLILYDSMTIEDSIIRNNSYGMYMYSVVATIENCLIYDNSRGIYAEDSTSTISNCTIASNTDYGIKAVNSSLTIFNCILWGNGDDLYNCSATYSCIGDGDSGTGNISSDPCFVDADNKDFHLNIHSPCVNAGDPNGDYDGQVDIDGDARITGSYVDMGADEVNVPVSDEHQWGLDEKSGTTAYDSVDSDDGTFSGDDPCWTDGLIGGAVDFNGVNDYFSVSNLDNGYSNSDTFTVASWFNTDQSTGIQTIVGQWSQMWEAGQEYFGWQVLVENNKVIARFGYGTISDITGTKTVTDGGWHHFAMVRNGNSTALYVDGQPEDSGTANFYALNTKFRIGDGSYKFNGNPALKGGPFDGKIDDVMIFDEALSAGDVNDLFEIGAPD